MEDKYNNNQLRSLFNGWVEQNYFPSMKVVAEKIGISYYTLLKWKNNQMDFGQLNLIKIMLFLQKHQQTA